MIAFFHYSPIDILSVCLPPSTLMFSSYEEQEWLRKETDEVCCMFGIFLVVFFIFSFSFQ